MDASAGREAAGRGGGLPPPAGVIAGIGGLYVAQSVIGGVAFVGLPAVLRASGMSLNDIAFMLLMVLPWSFKFLWAPVIERFRIPVGRPHRSRTVVAIVGAVAIACIVAAALVGPTAILPLTAILTVAAFASSTADIATDGYAVESLREEHRGWGNAAQVGGAYLGSAIGGGLFLVLVDHLGWTTATLIMSGVLFALGVPFMLRHDGRPPARATAPRPSLKAALRRPEVIRGLVLVGLYVFGQKWAMVLIEPFLIDAGLSLSEVGVLNGFAGMGVGLAGALGGGWIVRRIGADRTMLIALVAQVAITAGFAFAAWFGVKSNPVLAALTLSTSGVMALGFVALYAELMGRASLDQAGVDFTLFQCMDGVVSLIGWQLVGLFGDRLGFATCFGAFAACGLVAAIFLPRFAKA